MRRLIARLMRARRRRRASAIRRTLMGLPLELRVLALAVISNEDPKRPVQEHDEPDDHQECADVDRGSWRPPDMNTTR